MLREKQERDNSTEDSAEPRKSRPANQQPRISHQVPRILQRVIQPRDYQSAQPGGANDQESFAVTALLSAILEAAAHQRATAAAVNV